MSAEVKGAVGAARLLLGVVGGITTISGLINDSVVTALNTIGVVGLGALVVGGMVYGTPNARSEPGAPRRRCS